MNMMLISVALSSLMFPIVGKLCDMYPAKYIAPFAFLFRCLSTVMFYHLTAPNSVYAYAVCVLMIIGTIIENISIDTIFTKNLPKETRGIFNGLQSFSGQLGVLIYSLIAGWIFDNIGPYSPFVLIGVFDLLFACLVITMT